MGKGGGGRAPPPRGKSPPRRGGRAPSPSYSSSSSPKPKKVKRGSAFEGGGTDEKPVKVGVYKEIDDEEQRRKAAGEPPLSLPEKDAMFRNYARAQQGLPPLEQKDLLGPPINDDERKRMQQSNCTGGTMIKAKEKAKEK